MKLGKSITKTPEMLHEASGEHSLSRTAVFEWHLRFKDGQVSVEDDEHSGRPITSKMTENVEKKFENSPIKTAAQQSMSSQTPVGYEVCQEILTEKLNVRCIAVKFVPRLLTNDQKQWCVNVSSATREG
jgi:hypothetical protein